MRFFFYIAVKFDFYENESSVTCVLTYNADKYDKNQVVLFIERFKIVMNQIANTKEQFSKLTTREISFNYQKEKQAGKSKMLLEENF